MNLDLRRIGRCVERNEQRLADCLQVQRLAALRQAAEAGDRHKLEQGAHALKGITGTVGANELHDLAVRLEQIGREGRIQDAADLVIQLESALGRARPVFDRLLDAA